MTRLIDLSVREFVDAVASAERPVPAGGSVAALSGAQSAALLALVCGVLERHAPGSLAEPLAALEVLQRHLLELVDEDATTFDVFLAARRSGDDAQRLAAVRRLSATPLEVGRACVRIVALSFEVEGRPRVRNMRGDVRAARHLAQAAVRTAVDIAEDNLALQPDDQSRAALQRDISELRTSLGA